MTYFSGGDTTISIVGIAIGALIFFAFVMVASVFSHIPVLHTIHASISGRATLKKQEPKALQSRWLLLRRLRRHWLNELLGISSHAC